MRLAYYPVEIIIIYIFWRLVYSSVGDTIIAGFSYPQIISYFMIQRICQHMFSEYGISLAIQEDISSGNLHVYLSRPISYVKYLFASIVPSIIISGGFGIPVFILLAYILNLPFPTGLYNWIFFILSLGMSSIIVFSLNLLIGFSTFWFRDITYIRWLYFSVVDFISGAVIPLSFYPQWVQLILEYLPFQYIYYVPLLVFFDMATITEMLKLFIIQFLWICILLFFVKVTWNKGLKIFDAQGG